MEMFCSLRDHAMSHPAERSACQSSRFSRLHLLAAPLDLERVLLDLYMLAEFQPELSTRIKDAGIAIRHSRGRILFHTAGSRNGLEGVGIRVMVTQKGSCA